MSVTIAQNKEVIVITIKTDSKSIFPPFLQILGALCHCPTCFTVDKGLIQTKGPIFLGALQIIVGLITIGLGAAGTQILEVSYWLGTVYIITGIMSLCSRFFPSGYLVGFTALVNLCTACLSLVGFGLYAVDMQGVIYKHSSEGFFNKSLDIILIVLAFLQLCVCISMNVQSVMALVNRKKEEVEGNSNIYQPLKEDMSSQDA